MQALDELVARWRKNPDPESTLALCAHLGTAPEADLIREVASAAEAWHRDNHTVMLSVGRMYLDAGLLAEAQASLIQASKVNPKDTESYRFLGEVLLRRGDAVRAEKTFARAIHMGDDDAETRLWHERSVLYVPLQKRQGQTAVADEVARTAPREASIPAPALPFEQLDPEPGTAAARPNRRSRPPLASRPGGRRRSQAPGARRRGSTPPPSAAAQGAKSAPLDTLLMGRSPLPVSPLKEPVHPPSPFGPSNSHAPKQTRGTPASSNGSGPRSARTPGSVPRSGALSALARDAAQGPSREVPVNDTRPDPEPMGSDPFGDTFSAEERPELDAPEANARAAGAADAVDAGLDEARTEAPTLELERKSALAAPEPARPAPLSSQYPRSTPSVAPHGFGSHSFAPPASERAPSPETVLNELARVGLYEQDSSVVPAWEAAPRPAQRRLWVMAGAVTATVLLGLGGYRYALSVQSDRLAEAQALGMRVASALDSGSRAQLRQSDEDFQRLFELDSRGREPALLWLENRVLNTLLENEPVSGIESALQRARTVGIEESRLIFARLASSLAAGDLPGAGTIIAEWDQRATDDALYQLLSGVTFERAGNPEALERYKAAVALQPDLKLAHVFAARLALLSLSPADAKSVVEIACARLGAGPTASVLRGLQWAASPLANNTQPAVQLPEEALADLSPMMQATASAVNAVRAQREGRLEDSMNAFERALGPAATPAMAAWIGYHALDAGDVEIARLSALKAMQLSALHKSSQALSARIALAEGRLDAARDAVRGVDPNSRDAILIEAVSAYENLQGAQTVALVNSLPVDPAVATTLEALRESDKAIAGTAKAKDERLAALAGEQRLWGSVLAVDLALDSGRLALAERLSREGGWDAKVPAYAARLMRLRRYLGQGAAALELAPVLGDPRQATPRSLAEQVLTFVGEGRATGAESALGSMSAAAGGLGPWLEALVEAARGRQPNAAKQLAALTPPEKNRPLLEQVVALRALAAVKDRRAKAYYAQLERRFRGHPDVAEAGKQLGLVK